MKSEHYTQAERELLMQKVQMQMSQKRFEHVLGVEKRPLPLRKNMALHRSKPASPP